MRTSSAHRVQKLPLGAKREKLRERGQFWTPDWIADAMVAYVLSGGADEVFDPAVGAGAFFRAARRLRPGIRLRGTEIARATLEQARETGLTAEDLAEVQVDDFVLRPPRSLFPAIVANPPYIRHHRLSAETKVALRHFSRKLIGADLDGRAGFHVYFLLRALERLAPGGRLAFIVPADLFEGVFAGSLWRWITDHFRLDGLVTFSPQAAPFPNVDTNAVVVLIRREPSRPEVAWAVCTAAESPELPRWARRPGKRIGNGIEAVIRDLGEALATGLSRPPRKSAAGEAVLGDFVTVMRGIATGANDFFFLTSAQVRELGLPPSVLKRAVGRTRDVVGEEISAQDLERLDQGGRPTYLLSLDGDPLGKLSPAIRRYLREGETRLLPERALISTRNPWYRMEIRTPPPFFFAYLGRRSARFLRNRAEAVPLTGFLCVYPRPDSAHRLEELWKLLRHPATVANLALVGKSYGDGAIKVEPRALERLPLPSDALRAAGLEPVRAKPQLGLAFGA